MTRESRCADCGGFDVEWMYLCHKHHLEYCRGCSCPDCLDDLDDEDEDYGGHDMTNDID